MGVRTGPTVVMCGTQIGADEQDADEEQIPVPVRPGRIGGQREPRFGRGGRGLVGGHGTHRS